MLFARSVASSRAPNSSVLSIRMEGTKYIPRHLVEYHDSFLRTCSLCVMMRYDFVYGFLHIVWIAIVLSSVFQYTYIDDDSCLLRFQFICMRVSLIVLVDVVVVIFIAVVSRLKYVTNEKLVCMRTSSIAQSLILFFFWLSNYITLKLFFFRLWKEIGRERMIKKIKQFL